MQNIFWGVYKSGLGPTKSWASCAHPGGGGGDRGSGPPWKITKYSVPFHTVPDPLKNHKATKPAFNIGHYQHASVSLAGRWWPNFSGYQLKTHKKHQSWTLSEKTISANFCYNISFMVSLFEKDLYRFKLLQIKKKTTYAIISAFFSTQKNGFQGKP